MTSHPNSGRFDEIFGTERGSVLFSPHTRPKAPGAPQEPDPPGQPGAPTNEDLVDQAIAAAERFAGTYLTGNMRSALKVALDGYTLTPKAQP
jgi:hypothetical protein